MKCERCGAPEAKFTGSRKEWGMDESDASNTPESLPFGKAFLCEDCLNLAYHQMNVEMQKAIEENAKRSQVAKDLLREYRRHTHFPIYYPPKVARMSAYFRACKSLDAFTHVSKKYWSYWRTR